MLARVVALLTDASVSFQLYNLRTESGSEPYYLGMSSRCLLNYS